MVEIKMRNADTQLEEQVNAFQKRMEILEEALGKAKEVVMSEEAAACIEGCSNTLNEMAHDNAIISNGPDVRITGLGKVKLHLRSRRINTTSRSVTDMVIPQYMPQSNVAKQVPASGGDVSETAGDINLNKYGHEED